MDYTEFEKHLYVLDQFLLDRRAAAKALELFVDGWISITLGDGLMVSYIEMLASAVGDESRWIDWYVFENDCGREKMQAGYDGELKPVTNAQELYDLIKLKR